MTSDEARAFVPGHVTGLFSVCEGTEPAEIGSRGAGVTVTSGVTTTVRASDRRAVFLNDERVEIEPVERTLDALDAAVAVTLETELPIGSGFGVSGAASLGAALGAADVLGLARSENELITIAHEAEVRSDTGLGDVVAQARGGVPIRLEPGAPGHGRLDGIPAAGRVEFVALGDLSTEAILTGDTDRLSDAGERALSSLLDEPTVDQLMHASRQFAEEAELVTEEVREAIDAVGRSGGQAAMAMLGETVFALGTGLSDAGYDPHVTEIDPRGATLLAESVDF